jgi:RNA polymerase sigma factor (sigma-70 family)
LAKNNDKTTMGGQNKAFPVTRWTEIVNLEKSDEVQKVLIINELLKRYWKPVYCYLRRKGYNNETAKDLTQSFFGEVVLGRELIQQANQAKGRFRTFLLTAIDRYVIDLHRYQAARKRRPKGEIFQLDDMDVLNVLTETPDSTPEQSFHYAWISDLLDRVLCEVKNEFFNSKREIFWQVFDEKVLKPVISSSISPSLKEICVKYGIDREKKASNMIITVRRRLRKSLEHCMRQFAYSDSQVEREIAEMLRIFSK